MKKWSVFLFLPFMTSCFLMPLGAPHRYQYKALNDGEIKNVYVFCTPRIKTLHFTAAEGQDISVSSKVFSTTENTKLEYKDFFNHQQYQMNVRISDRKYHKVHQNDTIYVSSKSSNKKQAFVFVKE